MLLHRNADDVTEQGFRNQTGFGMPARGCGERTAVASDEVFAFPLFEVRSTTEILEETKSDLNPLLPGFALNRQEMVIRHSFPDFAHRRPQFLWTQLS